MNSWHDVILLTFGFVLSIGAGLVGAAIQRHFSQRTSRRPLNQLLNFGADDLLFVFPHRDTTPSAILPRTATEDFLAMNNIISALLKIGWTRKTGVRDMYRFTEIDKHRNLVIICSPKSNDVARMFQDTLIEMHSSCFKFCEDKHRVFIVDKDNALYQSPSYEQIEEYTRMGTSSHDMPGKHYEDFAIITKVTNPWNEKNKVLWVAGIRGIGTWGAAECLKKEWRQIYDRLPLHHKTCDFSVLLRIEYNNCDITSVEVRRTIPLGHMETD